MKKASYGGHSGKKPSLSGLSNHSKGKNVFEKQIVVVGKNQVKDLDKPLLLVAERIVKNFKWKFHHTSTLLRSFCVVYNIVVLKKIEELEEHLQAWSF